MKRAGLATVIVLTALLLCGCATEANRIGAIPTITPIGDFLAGLLQGVFVLIVAVVIVIGNFTGFTTDLYQSGKGLWYDVGFLVGLIIAISGPFGFLRLFLGRRNKDA